MIFCFGREGEAHVKFTNFRWEFPELEDYWDGNWLLVDLEIRADPSVAASSTRSCEQRRCVASWTI